MSIVFTNDEADKLKASLNEALKNIKKKNSQLEQLRQLCREQHEALKLAHENRNRIMPIATDIEIILAIEKYTKVMGS